MEPYLNVTASSYAKCGSASSRVVEISIVRTHNAGDRDYRGSNVGQRDRLSGRVGSNYLIAEQQRCSTQANSTHPLVNRSRSAAQEVRVPSISSCQRPRSTSSEDEIATRRRKRCA